jgi:hypothetical protein
MERDLSARFIDMDEHYFTPTMAKYQQEQDMQRTRSASSYEGGSVKAKGTITGFKPVSVVCVFQSVHCSYTLLTLRPNLGELALTNRSI